jgi:hypothetical protein
MRCFYLLLLAYAGLLPQALSAKTPTTTSADIGWFSKQLFVTLFTEPYEALKGKAEKVQMGIEMMEDFNLQQQIKAQLANIEPQIEAALKARPAATGALVFVNVESAVAGTAKSYPISLGL